MAKELHRLTATEIRNLRPGKYLDGGGLWLRKLDSGSAQWILRISIHGRRREMGIGGYPDVSLREARLEADNYRALVRKGVDPIKERERQRRAAARDRPTLAMVAEDAFEAKKAELKGDGKSGRWFSPLQVHVLPKLGKVPVEEIPALSRWPNRSL